LHARLAKVARCHDYLDETLVRHQPANGNETLRRGKKLISNLQKKSPFLKFLHLFRCFFVRNYEK
jgi:hypothetical protein